MIADDVSCRNCHWCRVPTVVTDQPFLERRLLDRTRRWYQEPSGLVFQRTRDRIDPAEIGPEGQDPAHDDGACKHQGREPASLHAPPTRPGPNGLAARWMSKGDVLDPRTLS